MYMNKLTTKASVIRIVSLLEREVKEFNVVQRRTTQNLFQKEKQTKNLFQATLWMLHFKESLIQRRVRGLRLI